MHVGFFVIDGCMLRDCLWLFHRVSVVELVESLQDRGNFGELEMLRLGGGACGCDGVVSRVE